MSTIYKAIEQASVVRDFDQTYEDESTRNGTKHFTGVLLRDENSTHGIYTSLFVDQDNNLFTFSNCFPGSYQTLQFSGGLVNATLENRTDAEKRMGRDIMSPDKSLHVTLKRYNNFDKIHAGKSVLVGTCGVTAKDSYTNFVTMHTDIDDGHV